MRSSRTLLVVEDDIEVRLATTRLLEAYGHAVVAVGSAEAALACLGEPGFSLALVLADYDLGQGLNGVELIGKVRERLGRKVAGVVITGHRRPDVEHGFDGLVLSKPVEAGTLAALVARLVEGAATADSR